jgi:hypothetical protein
MKHLLRSSALLFIATFVFTAPSFAQRDSSDPVLIALDAAIQSLKEKPNQFSLTVTSIGTMAVANGGGVGMSVVTTGGGAGSQTIGVNSRVDGSSIQISEATADAQLTSQAKAAVALLQEIRDSLQVKKPDVESISSRLSEFGKTYVAPALKAVIEALVKKRLGL